MSYPTPRETPERQSQPWVHHEASPSTSSAGPGKNRFSAVLSSPKRLLGRLYSPPSSQTAGLSPRSVSSQFHQNGNSDEDRSIASSRGTSNSGFKRTTHRLYERTLASFRSSRERQAARSRRVRRLIELIKKIKDGCYLGESEIIRIQLFPKDYIELLVEVDEQDSDFQYYFNNILRYDYRESRYGKSQLTIFMKSRFHSYMERAIDQEVLRSITQVQGHGDIIERILTTGDTPIEIGDKTLHADCSFTFDPIDLPPIVFEVAWSQERDDLETKAVEFLRETKGQVRTVVGFDFKGTFDAWETIRENVGTERLPNRGPARAFIWRATFNENGQQLLDADEQPILDKKNYKICDNDGKAYARPKRVLLSLKDFTPKEAILTDELDEQALDDVKLEIDPQYIIRHFDAALKLYRRECKLKEPKRIKRDEERKRVKEEQEAERAAAAEREHKKWTILDVVNVGRFNLRGSVRRDRPAGGAGREGGAV